MKRKNFVFQILLFICLLFVTTSCYNNEDFSRLQKECQSLEQQKHNIQQTVDIKQRQVDEYNRQLNDMRREMNILKTGKEPRYLIKIKIKQGTFTLDPFEHVKNEVNSIEMEMPVDRAFYNKVKVGDDLTDKFKAGSFWIDGDLSWLHMVVVSKRMK